LPNHAAHFANCADSQIARNININTLQTQSSLFTQHMNLRLTSCTENFTLCAVLIKQVAWWSYCQLRWIWCTTYLSSAAK